MSKVDVDIEITLAQRVVRADGTVEDLGVVASTADGSLTVEEQAARSWWQRIPPLPHSRKDPR